MDQLEIIEILNDVTCLNFLLCSKSKKIHPNNALRDELLSKGIEKLTFESLLSESTQAKALELIKDKGTSSIEQIEFKNINEVYSCEVKVLNKHELLFFNLLDQVEIEDKNILHFILDLNHEVANYITVLNTSLMYVQRRLKETDYQNNINKISYYADVSYQASNDIIDLINNMKGLVKNKGNPEKEVIDLNRLIFSHYKVIRPYIERNNVKFNIKYSNEKALININESRFKQLMLNLIKNSIEAMEEQENKVLTLEIVVDDLSVQFKVKDNGSGMLNEQKKNIFERNYSTKTSGDYRGLGMTIVNKIITEMQAKIDFYSMESLGTIVNIMIPKAKKRP